MKNEGSNMKLLWMDAGWMVFLYKSVVELRRYLDKASGQISV
jgi:hypothetical protein